MKENKPHYPHLFSPITIKNTAFKNRIISGPSGLAHSLTNDGMLRHDGAISYGARAKGGAGVVTLNESLNDTIFGKAHDSQLDMTNELILRSFQQFTDYIHFFNAKASMELNHPGKWANPDYIKRNPKGPSAMTTPGGTHVEEINEEDMHFFIDGFVHSALTAKRAGFDMCLLHAGHGWFIHQFLSPLDNKRTDEYGGSLENRARFPIRIIEAIRRAVGEEFIIEMRLSITELTEGGTQVGDAIEFVKMVEDKIDIVHCSVGTHTNPATRAITHPTYFLESGCNVHLAEAMKKSGVKIPVTAIGAINDPELAERIIAEGKADFVAMVRSFISDQDWAEKARAGRAEEIRPCLKCLHCLDTVAGHVALTSAGTQDCSKDSRRMECSVNPTFGREHLMHYYTQAASKDRKRILVIGGGPAGMNAALESVRKGNEVILFEKESELGGQIRYANYNISFKKEMKKYLDYLIRQVGKAGIDIRFNTEATRETVKNEEPEAVIVAVGASPFIPPIPGVDGPNVLHAAEAYTKVESLGRNVVIVGGGPVGCEQAIHLAQCGKAVTVIEMGPELIPDALFTERMHTLQHMEPLASVHTDMKCTRIDEKGVTAVDSEGREAFIKADTVVLATGMRPNRDLGNSFHGLAYNVVPVGDCVRLGNLVGATRSGFDAGLRF